MPLCIELGAKIVVSLFCWATNERAGVTPPDILFEILCTVKKS